MADAAPEPSPLSPRHPCPEPEFHRPRRAPFAAAGAVALAVAAVLSAYRPRHAETRVLSIPSAPAPAKPVGMVPVSFSEDDALKPAEPTVDAGCKESDVFYEDHKVTNVLGQPYELWRLDDARACPAGTEPVKMSRYSATWTAAFGTRSCFCRQDGDPPPPQ